MAGGEPRGQRSQPGRVNPTPPAILPSTLPILGETWKVDRVTRLLSGTEAAEGYTDHETQTIQIDAALTPQRARLTLLHEIMHAAWDLIGLPHGGDDEEVIVSGLSAVIVATCRASGLRFDT